MWQKVKHNSLEETEKSEKCTEESLHKTESEEESEGFS